MKIVDELFPPEGTQDVALSKVTIEYVQNLDCCQSAKDYPEEIQKLTLTTDDGGGGKFIRITTDISGWSIDSDSIEDFLKILSDFKQRIKCES